jgi:hypothetical protein
MGREVICNAIWKFSQLAQNFRRLRFVGGTLDEADYHDEAPSAAEPQPKLGVFPAKTLRRKGFKKKTLSELGAFAPWREEYPSPRPFLCRKICAWRANSEV